MADVTVDSVRAEPRDYAGTWTLHALDGTTDGDGTGAYDASLSYDGWIAGGWDLDWSRATDGTIDGTITGPRGATCVVSGTSDDVDVDVACDE